MNTAPVPVTTPRPRRATSRVGWRTLMPYAFVALLLWAAGRRDWGYGGANIPFLGAAVSFLGLLPAMRYASVRARDPERVGRVPFLPVLGVLYALYFGAPVLFADAFTVPTLEWSVPIVERTLWIALFGWIGLWCGWTVASRWAPRLVTPIELELDWERARATLPYVIGVGFAALVAQRVLTLPGGLVQPIRFLQMLMQAGIAIQLLLFFRGELTPTAKRVLWFGLIPGYLFIQVGHGSVAQLGYAGIFLMLVTWGADRRVPLATLGIGALAILLMRGHVHAFRSETWDEQGSAAEAGVWERSVLFVEMLVTRFQEDAGATFEDAFDEVSARVAHLGTFAHVVGMTPSQVPYWGGETYETLPTTWIPRALWPSKPSKEIGQAFGHRYHLIGDEDFTTAVNLPIPVELYANFGTLGMYAGMFFLGVLYFLLHRLLNTPGSGAGTLVISCILFSRLILIESDFTLVFGAVIQYAVLLVLFFRWLSPQPIDPGPTPRSAIRRRSMA